MSHLAKLFYRPAENHVGVIYRAGRFKRFVDPNRWVFTIPWLDTVHKESSLDMRTVQLSLKDVYTREKIPVDVDLKIFYLVDLREVTPAQRMQALRFPVEAVWDELVRTAINEFVRHSIFVARSFEELVTARGRRDLKMQLSAALAERVRGFGILLNPRFGVNIVDIQPNDAYRRALMEESAAAALGSAAAFRLAPMLEKLFAQNQEKAMAALMLQIASAVAKSGEVPDVIFPNTDEYRSGGITQGNGQGSNLPNIPGYSPPNNNKKPRSTAAD